MKVLADTLGDIEPQPCSSYQARLPAYIIADGNPIWSFATGGQASSHLRQHQLPPAIAIGLKNLGYTFVSPTAAEANRVIRELLPKLSNESHE
jgi:hypothetical protein